MLASWMPKSDETKARIKGYLDKHAGKEEINLAAPDSPFIAVCVRAEQYAAVLVAWWLPLLYGALGSMVFVVRCLSLQAQDRLFRKERLVALNMRIYLGMIAGLAIGWFWKDSTQTGITTLAPFALAFVAGYGVELFFALLDKIVTTFAKGPE